MAIVVDASSSGNSAGSGLTVTVSHTCTGSNLILWVAVLDQSGDSVTGVTYNGVAMTQAVKKASGVTPEYIYLYYLIAPATGANNVVATRTGTTGIIGVRNGSYTGAKQSGQPDATTITSYTDPLTGTITTVANNCYVAFGVRSNGNQTAGTNSTLRARIDPTDQWILYDNDTYGPVTPAGAFSMSVTGGGNKDGIMASFAPVVTAATFVSQIIII